MNASLLEDLTAKRALVLLGASIVVGGFVLALFSGSTSGNFGPYTPAASAQGNGNFFNLQVGNNPYVASSSTQVYTQTMTATYALTTTTNPGVPVNNTTAGSGSLLEFSSDLTIETLSPPQAAGQVIGFAYEVGGYVAYQATYRDSASVVIRVPASQYLQTMQKVENLGTVDSLTSNSNDVTVQYTDLNATLKSLRAEQSDLLRFLNQSSNISTTLSIETQLQGVNAQINSIQSQILQTKTLIQYSTIDVSIVKKQESGPLTISLKAAPGNGTIPLSVTFNAIVKGGAQPYTIIYNFGDGSTDQGQTIIHTYYQTGDFKVTVTATDQNGTAVTATAKVHVDQLPGQSGVNGFLGTISGLFVGVVEGIVEVAVVVLPLAAVGAVIVLPFRRRARAQKEIKQS